MHISGCYVFAVVMTFVVGLLFMRFANIIEAKDSWKPHPTHPISRKQLFLVLLVASTGPFGLFITALAAVASGGYLLITHPWMKKPAFKKDSNDRR